MPPRDPRMSQRRKPLKRPPPKKMKAHQLPRAMRKKQRRLIPKKRRKSRAPRKRTHGSNQTSPAVELLFKHEKEGASCVVIIVHIVASLAFPRLD